MSVTIKSREWYVTAIVLLMVAVSSLSVYQLGNKAKVKVPAPPPPIPVVICGAMPSSDNNEAAVDSLR